MGVPQVSVVVPTYNRATVLPASLTSLLGQDGVSFEVVVVDDGSTDGTAAMLTAHPDPRVIAVVRPHAGIAAARNAGIAAARAPLIAFHDSDDVALPGRLAVPVRYLESHPDIDLVVQNGRVLPRQGTGEGSVRPWVRPSVARRLARRPLGVAEVFRWNLGQLQGMCVTRRALDIAGPLDPTFTILDDLDLVLRLTLVGRAVFLDIPAFTYRLQGGVARNRARVREEAIHLAEKLAREHPAAIALVGHRVFARRQARRYTELARARGRDGDVAGAGAAFAAARALRPPSLLERLRRLAGRLGI